MGGKETMFFDPATGKLHTSKPTSAADPDKVVAIKMNDPESGGFFGFTKQLKDRHCAAFVTMQYSLEIGL